MLDSVIRSPRQLGNLMAQARRTAGMTQRDLGRKANLRQATISRLENGEGATLETLFALITVLDLELHLGMRTTASGLMDEIF